MRGLNFITSIAGGMLLLASQGPSAAIDYPYCMTYIEGWSGAIERCDYATLEQCRASAGGLNGSCARNWRLEFGPGEGATPDGRRVKPRRIVR